MTPQPPGHGGQSWGVGGVGESVVVRLETGGWHGATATASAAAAVMQQLEY
jgi:hypothetical protein